MYSLNVSELAHSDFDTIVKYIAIQLGNPTAATNLLDEVENATAICRTILLYMNDVMTPVWKKRVTEKRS